MNRMRKNNSFFILFLIIFTSFIFAGANVQAKEISLEEALNWGIENSSSIKEIKDSIETIERSLNLIDTEYGFQTKISANPIIAGDSSIITNDESNSSESSDGSKISLKTTKLFPNGIFLQSEISLKEEDLFDLE